MQSLDASLEYPFSALRIHVVLGVARQRCDHLDLLLREEFIQSFLARFGQNGQIAAIDHPCAGGSRRDDHPAKLRIQLGRATGEVEHPDGTSTHDVHHHSRHVGVHHLLTSGTRVDVTVLTGLIATVAEVDLKRFQFPTTQLRKIGISKERKGGVHLLARDRGPARVSPAPVMFLRIPE